MVNSRSSKGRALQQESLRVPNTFKKDVHLVRRINPLGGDNVDPEYNDFITTLQRLHKERSVTWSTLAQLFNVADSTIFGWIKRRRIKPDSFGEYQRLLSLFMKENGIELGKMTVKLDAGKVEEVRIMEDHIDKAIQILADHKEKILSKLDTLRVTAEKIEQDIKSLSKEDEKLNIALDALRDVQDKEKSVA